MLCLVACIGWTSGVSGIEKSDANIIGHVLDKKTSEHLPYITIALKGTTIGTVTDATGHYFLKNLPEGKFTLEYKALGIRLSLKKWA